MLLNVGRLLERTFAVPVGGGGGDLPDPPMGFAYVVNSNGDFFVTNDDAYVIQEIA